MNNKKIKKYPCTFCKALNDIDISWVSGGSWSSALGMETCWYCKKYFRYHFKNEKYGK